MEDTISIEDVIKIFLQWSCIWDIERSAIEHYLSIFNTSIEKLKGGDING